MSGRDDEPREVLPDPDRGEPFPERIGAYTPRRLLGRGAMAAVYLCDDPDGQPVAVKLLDASSPSVLHRFQRETSSLKRVRHPNVVRVISSGVSGGRPYTVMEYVPGQDLRIYANRLSLRPAQERYDEVRRVGAELCLALDAVHAQGLVHRDVKPSNVLLDRRGRVVLADFGVVKDPEDMERTAVGVMVGTTGYAAPEQIRGEGVDARADLYGLGCTLYTLLTGQRPYPGSERVDVARAHVHAPVPRPSAVDPFVPPALEATVMRLMAKAPEDRFPSARAARDALLAGADRGAPPPLAGRKRYLDAVNASLDKVTAGEGRVVRPVGPAGSGRSWLLEVIEDLARRRGVPVVVARDGATLHACLRRLRSGEQLAVACRLPLPPRADVPVDNIVLEPLGMADLRRTVVSVAPDTVEPHRVAERLHRASGGHPAWLLELVREHMRGSALVLPDPVPPPPDLLRKVEELSFEALETLGALAMLDGPADEPLLEQVTQVLVDDALEELREEGMVVGRAGAWMLMGEVVGAAAVRCLPDPDAVRGRVESARGLGLGRRIAPADEPPADPAALRLVGLGADTDAARRGLEEALFSSRQAMDRALELRCLVALGEVLMEQGQPAAAEARLADAVALARALELAPERFEAHVLRAAATLEGRPGSPAAAAMALDRLHRVMGAASVTAPAALAALGWAVQAQASAVVGDVRSWTRAAERADGLLASLEGPDRWRTELRLARAALAAGQPEQAVARARAVAEACDLPLLAWDAHRLARVGAGEGPPPLGALAARLDPETLLSVSRRPTG